MVAGAIIWRIQARVNDNRAGTADRLVNKRPRHLFSWVLQPIPLEVKRCC
jgi:hypothetical protein